ncbi:hypothetical protein SAY87_001557 [Trapa incisa]|uniref:Uncharacterized protein n=1 Tax=Trapa incisa TaxID=236973 RepID=A0AAN7JAH9_9MYRT|nr:hypothetical protein SAY87_001557 [Trapa incisa]
MGTDSLKLIHSGRRDFVRGDIRPWDRRWMSLICPRGDTFADTSSKGYSDYVCPLSVIHVDNTFQQQEANVSLLYNVLVLRGYNTPNSPFISLLQTLGCGC